MKFQSIKILSLLALLAILPVSAKAQDADYAKRVEAAKKYEQLNPPKQMIEHMLDEVAKNPQARFTPDDLAAMKASIDYDQVEKATLDALVKTFTLDELNAMANFYGSPTGLSIMKKMPSYMSQVMPVIQQTAMKSMVMRHQAQQQQQQQPAANSAAPIAP